MSDTQHFTSELYGFDLQFPSDFILTPNQQGMNLQIQCLVPNSNPQNGEPLGLVICEVVDPTLNLDYQGYVDLSIKNLQNMHEFASHLTSQNITNTSKKNSNGHNYEEIYYELVSKNVPDVITKLKTCVFFENGNGICLQTSSEASKFQSDLLDSSVDTAHFFPPEKIDDDDRFANYINDMNGIEFTYPKGWKIQDGLAQGMSQVTFHKPGSQTFGLVIVEPINPSLKFDFQKYVGVSLANVKNMKTMTQGKCDIHNLQNNSSSTSSGYNYEEISYELVDPNDSTKILSLMKQQIFFENDFGYVVQTTGPANTFDSGFMDTISDQIQFKTPKNFQ
eukprot:gene3679-6493_t